MSLSGLFSVLYSHLRGYAELTDDVLVELKSGQVTASCTNSKKLGQIFIDISKPDPTDFSVLLLKTLLLEKEGNNPKMWSQIGCDLRAGNTTPELVEYLGQVAKILENERTSTLAKLRGR